MVKNFPANAGDTGSVPGPGRSDVPHNSYTCVLQLLNLCSRQVFIWVHTQVHSVIEIMTVFIISACFLIPVYNFFPPHPQATMIHTFVCVF